MPIYEYACKSCGKVTDNLQKVNDPAPEKCPNCGEAGTLERMVSRTSFVLKGGGWYSDLYGSTKKDTGKEAGAASASTTPGATGAAPAATSTSSTPAAASPSTSSSGTSSGGSSSSSSSGSSSSGSSSSGSSSSGSSSSGGEKK